ncbi:MAG: elongation factor G [Anaerolineae bacterium]|nr:elongation factor G [Anaerolineae bacterium]
MKVYSTDKLRNAALVGHQGAGKTSLVEAMAFNTGAINRLGRIEERNTVADYEEEERERGMSIATSLVPCEFNGFKLNILDTPGYTDFQGEVKNAVRVSDAVVVVVDAVSGVEVGTELAWGFAEEANLPFIAVINKMDRENANYAAALESLRAAFPDYRFVPVVLPIGQEHEFKGVVNVLTGKAYLNAGGDTGDIPADMADAVDEARLELVEAAAESDEALMEKYFEQDDLSTEEVRLGIRKAASDPALKTVPVFAVSSTHNIAVVPLLEALSVYVPSPEKRAFEIVKGEGEEAEVEVVEGPQSDTGPLAAYVFKTSTDKFVGTLSYFRVFSGSMKADSRYFNTTSGEEERFGSLLILRGKEQSSVDELHVGDIGAVAKLNHTTTGDTLSTSKDKLCVNPSKFADPLYQVAVVPSTQADSAKMGAVLTNICDADPTLRWRQESSTKQTILEGMGEMHINVAIARAENLGLSLLTEIPKVPYLETVTRSATAVYRHKKQTGGAGQFAEVHLRVDPQERGVGFEFTSEIVGGSISGPFVQSTEKGVRQALDGGIIAGYPVVDVKAVVYDGKEHPVDSKDIAFQIAGRGAFREAAEAAGPVLLEPIMNVRVIVPEEHMGDVMSDMNTRRGRVQGMDTQTGRSVVSAQVPLAEMLRYGNDLRSMTGGRGIYEMEFDRYEPVPAFLQQEIVERLKREREEAS